MEIAIGSWTLRTDNCTLWNQQRGYEVDLERCFNSAQTLDWIFHCHGKFDKETLMGLIDAFEVVLDPCKNLCSFGADKDCKPTELVKSFEKRWKTSPHITPENWEDYSRRRRELHCGFKGGVEMLSVWNGKEFRWVQQLSDGFMPELFYVQQKRKAFSAKERFDILERDGFRCKVCGATADDGVKLHVDHIKPVSKGGDNHPSNLQTLCEECNLGKGDRY